MHHCMWWEGPCSNRPLPTPTVTGHYLCEQHIAQATAQLHALNQQAQALVAKQEMMQRSIPAAPPVTYTFKRTPIGKWLPPLLFAAWAVVTLLASLGSNPFAGVKMAFVWFVLVPISGWAWHWGFNDKGRRPYAGPGDSFFGRG
jgi:cytochrome bd-type quinol oxidase subunit 1